MFQANDADALLAIANWEVVSAKSASLVATFKRW